MVGEPATQRKKRVTLPGRVLTGEIIKQRLAKSSNQPQTSVEEPTRSEQPDLDCIDHDLEIITAASNDQQDADEDVK